MIPDWPDAALHDVGTVSSGQSTVPNSILNGSRRSEVTLVLEYGIKCRTQSFAGEKAATRHAITPTNNRKTGQKTSLQKKKTP
jgi:hypothetical protein